MPKSQFPSTITLSSLNGRNGFSIIGQTNDLSGWAVSMIGDINADGIKDLAIGAKGVSSNAGACYIVFGSRNFGTINTLDLRSLNGSNGFEILGVTSGDLTGYSISNAGDVNDDGITDLIIGAPQSSSQSGLAYIVFGKSSIGSSGTFALSNLNGSNGFKLMGISAGDSTGWAVSGIGDVNHDGIADCIISAPGAASSTGVSYILFGSKNLGSSGSLQLSSLTGSNGFKMLGTNANDALGYSVSGAGDINADGIQDFLVGAVGVSSYAGSTYVVFGSSGIGSSGTLLANTLNGVNGFTIIGTTSSDSGISVAAIGDVNADGVSDILIGAVIALQAAGASYVVFGAKNIGSSGTLALSSLNGINGFSLPGETAGDESGQCVSGAGDFNADGISDLIIGSAMAASSAGRTYVVFGKSGIGKNATIDLSSLNGSIGFQLDGINAGDYSGYALSSGDINGDGISDIFIGAFRASSLAGNTYAIFGGAIDLISNQLTIQKGHTLLLTNNNFNATNIGDTYDDPNLQFSITGLQHGSFELISSPSTPIVTFLQQQISNQRVQFLHDDSLFAPSFNVSISSGKLGVISLTPAKITFIHRGPMLTINTLTINQQGTAVLVTSSNLNAVDLDNPADNPSLLFIISNIQHGHFELLGSPGIPITSFTQAQIQSNRIQFFPDGTPIAPSFDVAVSDGGITTSPQACAVAFDAAPVLLKNSLTITQGQAVILTPNDLSATEPNFNPANLKFIASGIQHGNFAIVNSLMSIANFTQAMIEAGNIEFVTDGTLSAPQYSISVTDGKITTPPQACLITFNAALNQENNTVRNAIIGGIVSGVIGLLFLLLKLYLTHRAAKNLRKVLEGSATEIEKEQMAFHNDVVRPIVNKILERLDTAGCLGYRSEQQAKAYVASIEAIIGKLANKKVDIDLKSMSQIKRSQLLNEIAKQTKKFTVAKQPCCSMTRFCNLFRPQVTPEQIEDQANKIAAAVHKSLKKEMELEMEISGNAVP